MDDAAPTETPTTSDEPIRTPPAPDRPTFSHQTARHGLIGPFGGRQLAMGGLLVAAVVVALVAINAPLGNTADQNRPNPQPTAFVIGPATPGLRVGAVAPDFTTQRPDGSTFRLTDLNGKPVSLVDLRGKAVWVNFWASWCAPCQAETPVVRQTAATYKDRGLVVLGISVQESSSQDVSDYALKYSLGYTVAADLAGDVFHLYKVNALPTQFFIDPQGRIAAVVVGPLDQSNAYAHVEAILPSGS